MNTSALVATLFPNTAGFDYYVDQVNGNDGNDGLTPTTAWKTIGKITGTTFSAGKRVGLKRGCVWRESWFVSAGGTSGSPITYGAYGTGTDPRVTACDLVTGWTVDSGNRYRANYTNSNTIYQLIEDGVNVATLVASAALVNSAGKFYFDDAANVVYYWSTDSANPSTHTIEISDRYNTVTCDDRSNIVFTGLHFHGAGGQYGANFKIGPSAATSANITLNNCRMSYAYFAGNFITYKTGITPVDNVKLIKCEVDHNQTHGVLWEGEDTAHRITNMRVQECNIHDNGNATFGLYGLTIDKANTPVVTKSYVQNNSGYLDWSGNIYIQRSVNPEVSYCTVSGGNKTGIHFDVNTNGFVCKYNEVYDQGWNAIWVEEHISTNGASWIYGNTTYNCQTGITFGPGTTIHEVSGVVVKNNLCAFNTICNFQINDNDAGSSWLSNTVDYNLYWGNTGSGSWLGEFRSQNPRINQTFTQWKVYTSWDAHSIVVDPQFTNATARDFRLATTSPAINAGADLGSVYQVALGGVQTGVWDIGAYVV